MSQQKLELIFKETIKLKLTAKEIKKMINDALANSKSYMDRKEEIKTLRADLKMIKTGIEEDFSSEVNKLEELKLDEKSNKLLLSDMAISKLMAGEMVEVTDDYGNVYYPEWSVKFTKKK